MRSDHDGGGRARIRARGAVELLPPRESDPVKVWTWSCVFCAERNTCAVGIETREGDWLRVSCRACGRSTWLAVLARNLFPDRRRPRPVEEPI